MDSWIGDFVFCQKRTVGKLKLASVEKMENDGKIRPIVLLKSPLRLDIKNLGQNQSARYVDFLEHFSEALV